jgi:hypothetical protein
MNYQEFQAKYGTEWPMWICMAAERATDEWRTSLDREQAHTILERMCEDLLKATDSSIMPPVKEVCIVHQYVFGVCHFCGEVEVRV